LRLMHSVVLAPAPGARAVRVGPKGLDRLVAEHDGIANRLSGNAVIRLGFRRLQPDLAGP
jgi:hypothetical protein